MGESALVEVDEPRAVGRYVLYTPIARGGMATIHVARLVGDDGFSRIVAAKRLHPQFTEDPDFVEMFRDEAEIASKIRHPNVVPVLDIVLDGEEVVLVQEYVHGVPLDRLFRVACARSDLIPPRIVVGIVAGMLAGLHSAHETADEHGHPLGIIHRDVSPQNLMVSVDGIPRLLDFGIAKARSSAHVTRAGLLMGKIAYMAPEQVRSEVVTRAADVYSCGVVLWELLALRRLHTERGQAQILAAVLSGVMPTLTEGLEPFRPTLTKERWELYGRLEPIVSKAMATLPENRYASAAEMLHALTRVVPAASAHEVADWVKARGSDYLDRRQQVLVRIEESWRSMAKGAGTPGGPHSGVQRVRVDPNVVTAISVSDAVPRSAMYVQPQPGPDEVITGAARARRIRLVPWALASGLLLISAILVGALVAARQASVEAPPSAPAREPAAAVLVEAPPAASPAESVVPATSFLAPSMMAPRPTHAPAAPPPRRLPIESPAPLVHGSPAPAAASTAPAPRGDSRADCEPPFYFEGTKKVFKPSCI